LHAARRCCTRALQVARCRLHVASCVLHVRCGTSHVICCMYGRACARQWRGTAGTEQHCWREGGACSAGVSERSNEYAAMCAAAASSGTPSPVYYRGYATPTMLHYTPRLPYGLATVEQHGCTRWAGAGFKRNASALAHVGCGAVRVACCMCRTSYAGATSSCALCRMGRAFWGARRV
jgi:hypothetical protein